MLLFLLPLLVYLAAPLIARAALEELDPGRQWLRATAVLGLLLAVAATLAPYLPFWIELCFVASLLLILAVQPAKRIVIRLLPVPLFILLAAPAPFERLALAGMLAAAIAAGSLHAERSWRRSLSGAAETALPYLGLSLILIALGQAL